MRRRGIFLKIYLWFWFATALVVATEITLHNVLQSGPMGPPLRPFDSTSPGDRPTSAAAPPFRPFDSTLMLYGQAALECYLRGGKTALASFADRMQDLAGVRAYLVNPQNEELTDRPMPQQERSLAVRANQSGRAEHSRPEDGDLVAIPFAGSDGSHYVVIGNGFPMPPPPIDTSVPSLVFRAIAMLLISGLVCYWLAMYVTRPVIRLREATRRFAAGELAVRIGEDVGRGSDEFSELYNDFDRMAERIESLMTLQRQLLSDISHELRSPLARLNVAAELARQQAGPDAEKALNRIEKESELLNVMIGQLLTLTRFESGIGTMEMGPVDLAALLQQIASDADFEARGSNRTVQLLESAACSISGKGELLRRAIENVVRNAIRYTGEGTSVEIRLRQMTAGPIPYAEITVRDRGRGVPEAELPHLFRPFYRVSDSRERKTGGTGLGLAIAERAVKLHRGDVKASNAPYGGLIVTISLPLRSNN